VGGELAVLRVVARGPPAGDRSEPRRRCGVVAWSLGGDSGDDSVLKLGVFFLTTETWR
jgi:hypothetical protein